MNRERERDREREGEEGGREGGRGEREKGPIYKAKNNVVSLSNCSLYGALLALPGEFR